MNDFKMQAVSISDAPTIEFHVLGDTIRAELAGAKLYAESRGDENADLRITDASGEILADLVINRRAHRTLAENVMDIGSALLWSHWRFIHASPSMSDGTEKLTHVRVPAPYTGRKA